MTSATDTASGHISDEAQQVGPSAAAYWGRCLIVFTLLIWAASFVIGFQSALLMLSLLSFGATVVGLRWPVVGLFGVGMVCTLDAVMGPLVLTGGFLRWNTLNYWLVMVLLLSIPFFLRLSDPHTRLIQLFIVLLSLQVVISPDPTLGMLHLLDIILVFGLLVYFARAGEDDCIWYWQGLVNGTLAGAGGLAFYLQRDTIPVVNPNVWSFFPLTALFAICLALRFATYHRRGQLTLVLLMIVNTAWIFLSGSRGCLLIAIVSVTFVVFTMRGFASRVGLFVAAILIAIVISTQFTDLQATSLGRLNLLFDGDSSAASRTSGRSDLVLGAWYIFLDHPLGVGTGGFRSAFANLTAREGIYTYQAGEKSAAHSAWIQILSENGIPGIVLLASYVLSFAIVGLRQHNRYLFALGLLVTTTLGVAWISTELQSKGLWFLAAGATMVLHRRTIVAHLHAAARRDLILDIIRPESIDHG